MTKGEINLLCAEIDKLLNDICKFLNEEIDGGYLSDNGRQIASMLIERSKQQLHTITMTIDTNNPDSILESYVDMQAYKVNLNEKYPEPQEVYSDVSVADESNFIPVNTDEQIICPFINLPACETKSGKTGYLYKKEKILFFEQQRKIYAAIQQAWFLVYLNDQSLKPYQTFDLSRYKIRACQKDTKKRDESFELFSSTDTKMHQFTAQTSKDMYQWLAALKEEANSIVTIRNLPPVPAKHTDDDFVRLSSESNNDYEPLKNFLVKETNSLINNTVKTDPPLPLPPRNATIKKSTHLHKYIPKTPSTDSLSSNYDSVGSALIVPSQDASFSEDDSDTHYDDPSELRQSNIMPYVKQYEETKDDDDDNDIYDYLEKPSFPLTSNVERQVVTSRLSTDIPEPPKNQIKPKLVLKPKLSLSLRNRKKNGV